jgi:hypothetical protein
MACDCDPDKKKTYYSSVQLFSAPGEAGVRPQIRCPDLAGVYRAKQPCE